MSHSRREQTIHAGIAVVRHTLGTERLQSRHRRLRAKSLDLRRLVIPARDLSRAYSRISMW